MAARGHAAGSTPGRRSRHFMDLRDRAPWHGLCCLLARVNSGPPDRAEQRPSPPGDGRDHRDQGPILLVDDDAELRDELAAALTEVGYDVVSAANGREALDLQQARPLPRVFVLVLLLLVLFGWFFCVAVCGVFLL